MAKLRLGCHAAKSFMIATIKSLVRRAFYRSRFFQFVVGSASVLLRRSESLGIAHLLSYRDRDAIGPLQRDEAIGLFGIVRTVRPKTVVEFGFFHGHSAFNFLQALDREAKLYSYDIADDSARRAEKEFASENRLIFMHKSQIEFDSGDIDDQPIDFLFFDAAHDLALNVETFKRVLPQLAHGAIIAVHDTGLWERAHFSAINRQFVQHSAGRWVSEESYAHQPEEREFVNWITSTYPTFGAIHLHSARTLRHGFSLLQRQFPLESRVPDKAQP